MDALPGVHPGTELLRLLPCLLPFFSILHALRRNRAVCHYIHNVLFQGEMLLELGKKDNRLQDNAGKFLHYNLL